MPSNNTSRSGLKVAALKPFWRWAVCLEHRPDIPAIPYYRRAAADAFAAESRAAFPTATTLVLKRTGWRTLEACDD